MDELRRVLLPTELCSKLNWTAGRKVTAQVDQPNKFLTIHTADDGDMQIDQLSRVALTEDICSELGWHSGEISIAISTDGLYLVLEQKNM